MITVNASRREPICLRHQGENDAMQVAFPLSAFEADWPGGTPLLLVQRPRASRDTEAYPVALSVDGHTAYWTVSASDVEYSGYGKAQLQWRVEDVLVKSCIYDTVCVPSLHAGTEPPDDPSKRWFDAIQAQIGNLDDLTTEEKKNLVAAINEAARSGGGGSGTVTEADIEKALGYKPIGADDVPVKKVNGATGDVKSTFYVTITSAEDESISADKTLEEIYTAYEKGYAVYAKTATSPQIMVPLTIAVHSGNDYAVVFNGAITFGDTTEYAISNDGSGWTIYAKDIAFKDNIPTIPTALKNPHPLNIKIGNATTTYDGSTEQTVEIPDGGTGKDGITPTIGANGNWYLGDEDTGKPSRGATGPQGADGKDGTNGTDGAPGKDGADGAPGKDGITPTIGANGNWYLGDEDTGKPSRGATGPQGADGKDGTNGTDGAPGKDGADGAPGKDGITPTIGENGNWYLGDEDTGKPSRGATGPQGADGKDGTNGTDGADGHTPVITASKSGKVTTIKADGEAIATVNDGADGTNGTDGAPGKDGADGAPGKDGSPGKDGAPGADGTTFTPSVSAAGDLSWTNDGGKANPAPVNLKGQQGPAGDDYVLTPADKTQIAEAVIAGGQEVQVGEPLAGPTDAQVSSAVDTWLADHPEATTTVQDGSVSIKKLGYGKHVYGSKPYFCNSVGSGAVSYGSIGVVVPCKAGDTIYCNFNMSPNGAYKKPQLLAALPENQYGAIAPIGTIEKDDTTKAYTVPASATTAKAMYLPQNFVGIPAANNGSVEDALAWINKTMGTDGSKCAQNVPFEDYDAWYQTAQAELFDIDESCNKLMYASLYQAVSKLVGAKVAVLGDSLTEQSACSFITSAYNDRWMENVLRDTALTGDDGKTYKGSGWFALIARKYKIKWWCAGHGAQWWYSTTERPNGATAMVRKLIDGTDEFDYIVLEYGTNDILSGYTHIGTVADEASETATTSCGAIKWCIEQLQMRFPEASIVVILPNIRSGANGESPAMQQTYLDTVVPILKKYGVRRVNMAEDSGIVKSMMSTDGVHLRWPVVSNNVTHYTNDTPAVRKFSKCLEAELLKA